MSPLRVGCLAWGSLVWDPRTLPCGGPFREDGPRLPIEFSRVAKDGRVTLVIDPTAGTIQTLWVPLRVDTLDEAIRELGLREKIKRAYWPQWVGVDIPSGPSFNQGEIDPTIRESIAVWLEDQALDAVLWTALPTRGPEGEPERPSFEVLLSHLKTLDSAASLRAEEYIRRTPTSVRTANRAGFEAALGWTPTAGGE